MCAVYICIRAGVMLLGKWERHASEESTVSGDMSRYDKQAVLFTYQTTSTLLISDATKTDLACYDGYKILQNIAYVQCGPRVCSLLLG